MESDSIRPQGNNTLVDIWLEGKIRAICVTHEAIGAFLGFDEAARMTDRDRCEFVRAHLPLVASAAKIQLREDPSSNAVTIGVGQLARPDGRSGDRRKAERRTDERRKAVRPNKDQTERRRRERRQGERRTSPKGE